MTRDALKRSGYPGAQDQTSQFEVKLQLGRSHVGLSLDLMIGAAKHQSVRHPVERRGNQAGPGSWQNRIPSDAPL